MTNFFSPNNICIVTGSGGMDGSILSEKLLAKGYTVVGINRWSPTGLSENLKECIKNKNFIIETGDITDKEFMYRTITKYHPDYFYNIAAISLVPESFKIPMTVFETNAIAVLNILELIRNYSPKTRFYQASTSEQIGRNKNVPQNTESLMDPNSPYAIAKLSAYQLVRCYRDAFGIFAVNGMLWNHEGERRGPTFVTRKITLHISSGTKEPLQIGNLDAFRDWGYAPDFCDAMILMMETDVSDDYAVNTGETHSIREFIEEAYSLIGKKVIWKDKGKEEKGYDDQGNLLVKVNEKYYRPVEVPYLQGDHSKITEKLGWEPKVKFKELVKIMVENDIKLFGGSL
ncbi:MAG: GDP-mannose 4,6-dehydratase [archaeon]|nr:GDP-mannose 4,6-dehydratase [archaeon]